MITYKKINPIQSKVLYNFVQVGWLEKPFNVNYKLEVNYSKQIEIPNNRKQIIEPLATQIVERWKAREFRSMQPLRKFTDFKILI